MRTIELKYTIKKAIIAPSRKSKDCTLFKNIAMSRHSKWANIKRRKEVSDKKRSAVFTRLAYAITIAARQGQPDPTMNFKLRMAMDKARAANMPKDNIERAIAKAKGSEGEAPPEPIQFELMGPGGVGILVVATTDNRNRVLGAIKAVLSRHDASLAGPNAVLWQFALRGHLALAKPGDTARRDEIELIAIDAGCVEVEEDEETLIIITKPADLETIKSRFEEKGIAIDDYGLSLIPTHTIPVDEAAIQNKLDTLIESLEEIDEVDEVITNAA